MSESINTRLIAALSPLGFPVYPDQYDGDEPVYLTFNYSVLGALFADDSPSFDRYLIQVHLYAPLKWNSVQARRVVKRRLFSAGFTWPDETDAANASQSEWDTWQHIVFECEAEEGVADGEALD